MLLLSSLMYTFPKGRRKDLFIFRIFHVYTGLNNFNVERVPTNYSLITLPIERNNVVCTVINDQQKQIRLRFF